VGTDPLVAVGAGSFLNEVIGLAGGENLTAAAASAYPRYSREAVLTLNPEVIVMVDMGNMSAAEARRWQALGVVSAAKSGRLHLLKAQELCIPTPRHLAASARRLAALFHPGVALP
ncbi:MAG TPA: cobalamin-binding protein, partial [bacterium]|nr:cobalamin-binding protein [bacterium]